MRIGRWQFPCWSIQFSRFLLIAIVLFIYNIEERKGLGSTFHLNYVTHCSTVSCILDRPRYVILLDNFLKRKIKLYCNVWSINLVNEFRDAKIWLVPFVLGLSFQSFLFFFLLINATRVCFPPVNRTALCREIHHSGKLLISLSKLTTCTKYPASAVTEQLAGRRGREAGRLTHLREQNEPVEGRRPPSFLDEYTPGDLSRRRG